MLFGFMIVPNCDASAARKSTNEDGIAAAPHPMGCAPMNGSRSTAPIEVAVENARDTVSAPGANGKPKSSASKTGCETPEPESFAPFWARYPLKEARKPAVKAYAKAVKISPPEEIAHGLEGYIAAKSQQAWRAWMLATTFLNQERWKDYLGTTGAISRSRTEWVCAHEPRCPHREACALTVAKQCPHDPVCASRVECYTKTLEGWR